MKRLTLPKIDDVSTYDGIVRAKYHPNSSRLRACRANVIGAYSRYEAVAPGVEQLQREMLATTHVSALLHAYRVRTQPFLRLHEALLTDDAIECPFCSLNEASTLDHYLPKENFPEFAVFSRNLIPCCSRCNELKGRRVTDAGSRSRIFVHPYFDAVPNSQFLQLDVRLTANAMSLRYKVVQPRGCSNEIYEHLRRHFAALKLSERYRLMALPELRGQLLTFRRLYGPARDAGRVKERLRENAETHAAGLGRNDWRAVLYSALAQHVDFCDGGFEVIGAR